MNTYRLFFSWQSDKKEIKKIIMDALLEVRKTLKAKSINLVLDQDTRDRIGKRDIKTDVLNKIEKCDIFLADLTPITTIPEDKEHDKLPKHMPNGNVMFEYGYALRSKGENRMIVLAHLDKGEHVEFMPFDINHDTITCFTDAKGIKNLGQWVENILKDVDEERAQLVPEYSCCLLFKGLTDELTITPQYRQISYIKKFETNYVPHAESQPSLAEVATSALALQQSIMDRLSIIHPTRAEIVKPTTKTTNLSYCPVNVVFFNKGTAPLQNCRVTLTASDDRVLFSDSNVKSAYAFPKIKGRESTFASEEGVTQRIDILNPSDCHVFDEFFVHAPHDIGTFKLEWSLSSMYHSANGEITINVSPQYKYDTIEKDSKQGMVEVFDVEISE